MNSPIKKGGVLLLVMLLSVAGCGKKKKHAEKPQTPKQTSTVSMPQPQQENKKELSSVFDDDIAEFALVDDATNNEAEKTAAANAYNPATGEDAGNEFSWIDGNDESKYDLKTVYFDFDKYTVRRDQEKAVAHNIETLKQVIAQAEKEGKTATVVIEGHACHSAGSASYNLALSEKRAKVLKDHLVQAGIPSTNIKIVGRGQECPALTKDGKPVTGSREEQWPNRRDEINILQA
jgi:outer membrane protein OmpA-like peptidoglycan-associated protein